MSNQIELTLNIPCESRNVEGIYINVIYGDTKEKDAEPFVVIVPEVDPETSKKLCMKKYNSSRAERYKQCSKDNKETVSLRRKEKITCCCGSVIARASMPNHVKSKKHLAFNA